MDPNEDILEELECGICMDPYTDPKTLPCIHTFCRLCIARHVISQRVQHERMKGFLCPLCRFAVRVPRPDAPIEQWANQMPNNTQIPRIIKTCQDRLRETNTMCVYHPQENATSFCKLCNCVACSKCLSERHPSCRGDAFVTVKEMAVKRKEDMAQGVRKLNLEKQRMTDNVELVRSVVSGLSDAGWDLIRQIQEHALLSSQAISQQESELLDKLDAASAKQLEDLKRAKNPMDEAADVIRLYKEEMASLKKSSTGQNFMDTLEVMKERHRECLEMLRNLQSQCRPPSVTFVEHDILSVPVFGKLLTSDSFDDDVFDDSSLLGASNTSNLFESGSESSPAEARGSKTPGGPSAGPAHPAQPAQRSSPLMMYLKALGSPATNAAKRKTSSQNSRGST